MNHSEIEAVFSATSARSWRKKPSRSEGRRKGVALPPPPALEASSSWTPFHASPLHGCEYGTVWPRDATGRARGGNPCLPGPTVVAKHATRSILRCSAVFRGRHGWPRQPGVATVGPGRMRGLRIGAGIRWTGSPPASPTRGVTPGYPGRLPNHPVAGTVRLGSGD